METLRKKFILLAMAGIAFAMPASSQLIHTQPYYPSHRYNWSVIDSLSEQQKNTSTESKELPDNTLAYIIAIVAIITSAATSAFFLIERKKNSRLKFLSEKKVEDIEKRLAEIEQSIKVFVIKDDLDNKLSEIRKEINNNKSVNTVSVHLLKNNDKQMPTKQEKRGDKEKKKGDIVYASASLRESIISLSIVDGAMAAYMPFELHINDTDCQVLFNQSSFSTVVSSMETKILPYVDLQIHNRDHPTSIRTIVPGKALKQGELWILKTKPKLELI